MAEKNPPASEISLVCTLDTKVTAKQAKIIEKALSKAVQEAYPDRRIRGLWVHQSLDRDNEKYRRLCDEYGERWHEAFID